MLLKPPVKSTACKTFECFIYCMNIWTWNTENTYSNVFSMRWYERLPAHLHTQGKLNKGTNTSNVFTTLVLRVAYYLMPVHAYFSFVQTSPHRSNMRCWRVEANSYERLKMTNRVLCKMTNLYFEDDQPVLWRWPTIGY